MDNNHYLPWYQPVVNAFTGKICGAEVLARKRCEDTLSNPFASPCRLTKAMRNNVFLQIFRQSVREMCDFAYCFQTCSSDHFFVSYNTDASVLESASDEIYSLAVELKTYQVQMVAEILEHDNYAFNSLHEQIQKLKAVCKFALDDFGQKHSGIMQLFYITPDFIKLDKAIFKVDGDITTLQYQLKAFNGFCKSLNMKLIIEGVETEEHVMLLDSAGISLRQGYFYYHPLTFKELLLNLERQGY